MLKFEYSAGAPSYEVFFMNGLNRTNNTSRFLSGHACMNRGSAVGKNMNYIMWKYVVPPKMCRGAYVAINKLITKSYTNNIKTDDAIHASIIAECIYTIIFHKPVCLSVGVRKLQVAILARSSREMSLADRNHPRYILSRVRISVRPSNFPSAIFSSTRK